MFIYLLCRNVKKDIIAASMLHPFKIHVISYSHLGAFVVLFSTALSQKNTAPARNANSAAKPAANPSVSQKGINVISSNSRPTYNANIVTEANREGVTDVPEEREIGEDPTTSVDGLTQRTESNYGSKTACL